MDEYWCGQCNVCFRVPKGQKPSYCLGPCQRPMCPQCASESDDGYCDECRNDRNY